jgi:ketosteroid isomerase-like protein
VWTMGVCWSRDTAQAMSRENLEVVRRLYELVAAGDRDGVVQLLDPDVVWVETASLGPDAQTYRGPEEIWGAIDSWTSMWTDYDFHVDQYLEAESGVVVLIRESGQGQTSGASAERELGVVYTLQAGKVLLARLYNGWANALEAAGLAT